MITQLGDDRVADVPDLVAAVARRRPGDPVEITFWRASRHPRVTATLGDQRAPAGTVATP